MHVDTPHSCVVSPPTPKDRSAGLNFVMRGILITLLLCAVIANVLCDIYMHNPRGSNNRLSERPNNRNNANRLFDSQNNARGGYNTGTMYYYEGSTMLMEWTQQHACSSVNADCQLIIQYMCEDTAGTGIRDGQTTNTIKANLAAGEQDDYTRGRHEAQTFYQECATRERNKGLFTADQVLRGNSARFTRQNPRGNRYGLECPEERDYYPYWHPTPWVDVAVLVSNTSMCSYYQTESQNIQNKGSCSIPKYNNGFDCTKANGEWTETGARNLPPPECRKADFGRDNAHSGTYGGEFPRYEWDVPKNVSNSDNCVVRIRYNISTGEYDGFDVANVNSKYNGKQTVDGQTVGRLPVDNDYFLTNNPDVPFGSGGLKLALAMNTAQYGRTFQDRSHTFSIRERDGVTPLEDDRIVNLNVRGKRGNIVQVYPAVEYDFIPDVLTVNDNDYVHIQWTGSNTNNNNNDGQGTRGTDRSNMVMMDTRGENLPVYLANVTMFPTNATDVELQIKDIATLHQNDDELNDAAPYYDHGVVQLAPGTHNYMCTRNNNFSNRSQKGTLVVSRIPEPTQSIPLALIAGALVGTALIGSTLAVATPIVASKTGIVSKIAVGLGLLKAKIAARVALAAAH